MYLNITRRLRHIGTTLAVFAATISVLQAQVDLSASAIVSPTGTVPILTPIPVRFVVENLGNAAAPAYACNVQILDIGTAQIVYTGTAQGAAGLAPGAQTTLTASGAWTPNAAGAYRVQVFVQVPNDIAPTNNQRADSCRAMLTLTQAIALLDTAVLNAHPRRDSLVAWITRPPSLPLDSIIPPGSAIRPADSAFTLLYEYPIYLFFVDYHPDMLYSHPCEFVTVSTINGAVERHPAELWPVVNDQEPTFGPSCGANPNRVRGRPANCIEKQNPYVAVPTANAADWAIAVAGKLNLDIEKTTVDHDICRFKERMNGTPFGPGITGTNIAVHMGTNKCGLTKKEFCDALNALKGKGCSKVFVKYVGHGTTQGLVFWDSAHKGSEIVSYHEIACKLKEAGITNACIEITACHSGGIIKELEKKGIKGVVITSSSVSNTTPVGEGDGTYWEKALEACSKDSLANVNKDSKIDNCELFAWVKAKGGTAANGPNPQISKLSDSIRYGNARIERVGGVQSVSTNGGSIKIYAERFCVATRYRNAQGKWRDTVAYRGAVYMENEGNDRKTSTRKYRVIARCKSGNKVLVEEIVPDVNGKTKICIADLPNDCSGIAVEEIRKKGRTKGGDDRSILSAGDEVHVESFTGASVHDDSTLYALYRHVIPAPTSDHQFTAHVAGPAGWFLFTEPESFTVQGGTSGDLFTGAVPPTGTIFGGEITTTLADVTAGDTLLLHYHMLLADTISSPAPAVLERRYNQIMTSDPLTIDADTIRLNGVRIEAGDSLRMTAGPGDVWTIEETTINAEGGVYADYHISGGRHDYHNVILRGLHDGIGIDGGSGSLNGVVVGDSHGNGLTVTGTTIAGMQMQFVDVIGAERFGLDVADVGSDALNIHGLRVLLADSLDVHVHKPGTMTCTDCEYDDARVAILANASLNRYATLSVSVRDTADTPIAGATVTAVDSAGRTLFTEQTDANGVIGAQQVPVSYRRPGVYTSYQPIAVTVRKGSETRTIEYRSATYHQVLFELNGSGGAAVPGVAAGAGGMTISRIVPQPAHRMGVLLVEGAGLAADGLIAEIVDMLGRSVARVTPRAIDDAHLTIALEPADLSAGVYVLRLADSGGRGITRRFVVR